MKHWQLGRCQDYGAEVYQCLSVICNSIGTLLYAVGEMEQCICKVMLLPTPALCKIIEALWKQNVVGYMKIYSDKLCVNKT